MTSPPPTRLECPESAEHGIQYVDRLVSADPDGVSAYRLGCLHVAVVDDGNPRMILCVVDDAHGMQRVVRSVPAGRGYDMCDLDCGHVRPADSSEGASDVS